MNITQVKVFPVQEEKLKAFVSVVFDHDFMVNDIKIIQGKDGLFLSMPSRRKKNGEFKDVAHPLNIETRRQLEERVLAEYRQVVDDPTPRRPDRRPDTGRERSGPRPQQAGQQGPPAAARPPAEPSAAAPSPDEPSPAEPPPAEPSPAEPTPAASPPASPPAAAAPPAAPSPAAPSPAAPPPAVPPSPEAQTATPSSPAASDDKTLEEVQEAHLRDSFWTVS